MTTETRKRREYTEDFKRDAVALVTEQGYKPSEAARSLGIGDNLIRRWKREFEEEVFLLMRPTITHTRALSMICEILTNTHEENIMRRLRMIQQVNPRMRN